MQTLFFFIIFLTGFNS